MGKAASGKVGEHLSLSTGCVYWVSWACIKWGKRKKIFAETIAPWVLLGIQWGRVWLAYGYESAEVGISSRYFLDANEGFGWFGTAALAKQFE